MDTFVLYTLSGLKEEKSESFLLSFQTFHVNLETKDR